MATGTTIKMAARREAMRRRWRDLPLEEESIGRLFHGGWRRLYGDFHGSGASIEWHDFELGAGETLEWSRSFRAGSLELCLNLAGHGFIRCAGSTAEFQPLQAGFYAVGKNELRAWRKPGEQHRFITVEFSPVFLRSRLAQCDGALNRMVDRFLRADRLPSGLSDVRRLSAEQEQLVPQLLRPPTFQGARRIWYEGKVLQLMAEFFFERRDGDELFCDRQKRLARERVERVAAILRRDLAKPPALEAIGREAGCSPFYLSRTFSRETGMTIPQFLRKLRMERAGELLRSGRYNVTEAALEVGYSSLSHFSQAFCQAMGCCPALYPLKATARPASGAPLPPK